MEKKIDILAKVPHSRGLYKLYDNDKLLFVGISSDLKNRIKHFLEIPNLENPDKKLAWTKNINNFKYETSSSLWQLILKKKEIMKNEFPINQFQYNLHDNYVYLAINFENPPFLKITDDTQNDSFYIGPFRDRFFLMDILTILEQQFGAPICEKEIENCQKHNQGLCKGFCLSDKSVFKEFVINFILSKPDKEIKKLETQFDKFEEELEFEKSDELKIILKKLNKFYSLLEGLILSKQLQYTWIEQNKKYEVERGKLLKISSNQIVLDEFNPKTIEFRPNEIIAYEKSDIDEALIIYEHLKKSFPNEINKLFIEAKKYILTKIMED